MKKIFLFIFFGIICIPHKSLSQVAGAMFHGGESHGGVFPVKEYKGFGGPKWKFKTNGKIFSSPVVNDGVAYVGSEDQNLYAIEVETGTLKWKFPTGGAVHTSPAYYNGVVYLGSFDGYYYALDAETGKEKWRFKTEGERWMGEKGYWGMKPMEEYHNDPWDFFLSSPALDKNQQDLRVYFGSSDGHLYALNAATGKLEWKFKTGGIIHSSPALYKGRVYVGSWDSKMYALDAKTGDLVWSFQTGTQPGMNGIQASPTLDNGKVFFGARDGFFYALDAASGELIWKYDAEKSWIISTAGAKDGTVYFGTSDSYLFLALDAITGKEKFRVKTHGYVYSSPALVGNTAYVGDFTGKILAVDLVKGKRNGGFETAGRNKHAGQVLSRDGSMNFRELAKGKDISFYTFTVEVMDQFYSLGSIVSSPAVGEGVLFFGSADGYLYAVQLEDKMP